MMPDKSDIINVAVISLDIVWGNPEINLDATETLVRRLPAETDIVVVPELFTTGFIQDAVLLKKFSSPTYVEMSLSRLKILSAECDCAICGSITAEDNGMIFNRAFFIKPDGATTFYDKRHLFSVSAELKLYSPGRATLPVVNYKGWNISMMVCYDLRFPVWSRSRHHSYDMMLVPANWPQARGYAWTHLLICRAIENQAVYVGCDRGGTDDYGDYDGLSQVYDGTGHPVAKVIEGTEERPVVQYATVSLSELQKARRRLPVVDAADDFKLIIN